MKDRRTGAVSKGQVSLGRGTSLPQLQQALATAAAGMRVVAVHFLDEGTPVPLASEHDLKRAVKLGVVRMGRLARG